MVWYLGLRKSDIRKKAGRNCLISRLVHHCFVSWLVNNNNEAAAESKFKRACEYEYFKDCGWVQLNWASPLLVVYEYLYFITSDGVDVIEKDGINAIGEVIKERVYVSQETKQGLVKYFEKKLSVVCTNAHLGHVTDENSIEILEGNIGPILGFNNTLRLK